MTISSLPASPVVVIFESLFSASRRLVQSEVSVITTNPTASSTKSLTRLVFSYQLSEQINFSDQYYCRLVGGTGLDFTAFVFADFASPITHFRGDLVSFVGLYKPLNCSNPWIPVASSAASIIGNLFIAPTYPTAQEVTADINFSLIFEFATKEWITKNGGTSS